MKSQAVRRTSLLLAAVLSFALVAGCGENEASDGELLIFAAASLADSLGEIEESFEKGADIDLIFSYGASQALAQQIASGAPADVFIPAGRFPAEFLTERGAVEPNVSDLLINRLVVVARPDLGVELSSIEQLSDSRVDRVAVAAPDLAPAGRYAREALRTLGLWDGLEPKLVFGPDVRATMAYVESGNADVALVYVTDANMAQNLDLLDIVPPESYSPVTYPVAVVDRTERDTDATTEFLSFLHSGGARSVFERHGFQMAEESP